MNNTSFELDMPVLESTNERDFQMDDSIDVTSENDSISWWQDEK